MADALPRRNDPNVLERVLRPFQEVVTLLIALELKGHVRLEGLFAPEFVRDDGMVDDQVAGYLGVDLRWVAAKLSARFTHHGEIDEHRNSREILEQDACRRELDLVTRLTLQARIEDTLGVRQRLSISPRAT